MSEPKRLERTSRAAKAGAPPDVQTPHSAPAGKVPKMLDGLIGFQLRRAHTLFALHWQQTFRDQPVRITPVQGGILIVINSQPGLSQTALAEIMDVEGSTLVQVLDRMEEAGLILRVRRAEDRRSYSLTLTDAGSEALLAVDAVVEFREAELLACLSDDERDQLADLLRRVVNQAHAVTDPQASPAVTPRADASSKAAAR